MMKEFSVVTAVCAVVLGTNPAVAQGLSGDLSLWGQWVEPTWTQGDNETCFAAVNPEQEYCNGVPGGGISASVTIPLANDTMLYADVIGDMHEAMTLDDPALVSENGRYVGVGLHYIAEAANTARGLYVTVVGATTNHVDNFDYSGVMVGVGAEQRWGNVYVQGGVMTNVSDGAKTGEAEAENIDGLRGMRYLKVGREDAFAGGVLESGIAFGTGRATGPKATAAKVNWGQYAVQYTAPLAGDLDWFLGYQGDLIDGIEVNRVNFETTFLHSVQIGVSMQFGAGQSPFATPNFRGPITNAAEMN